jgi:hypothetical protein
MALSFSGISAYTREQIAPLLTEAVFSAKTQSIIKAGGILLPKTKSSVKIPKMTTNANFQEDTCSWNPSGNTTLTQASITVGKIKVEESICPKDFEAYFAQEALKAGSTYEDFGWSDFQTKFTEQKNLLIAKQLEVSMWQGDTTSSNPNLSPFDGLIKLINAGSPVNANVSGFVSGGPIATITASNVVSVLNAVYRAIPVEIIDATDLKVMVGNDVYRLAVLAYQQLNLFNYKVDADANQTFIIPGTNVELVAVNGLNGTGDIFATTLSNLAMAFDLEAEEENYSIWYSKDNNDVRYRVAFKMGVGVAYTQLVVRFISAV